MFDSRHPWIDGNRSSRMFQLYAEFERRSLIVREFELTVRESCFRLSASIVDVFGLNFKTSDSGSNVRKSISWISNFTNCHWLRRTHCLFSATVSMIPVDNIGTPALQINFRFSIFKSPFGGWKLSVTFSCKIQSNSQLLAAFNFANSNS